MLCIIKTFLIKDDLIKSISSQSVFFPSFLQYLRMEHLGKDNAEIPQVHVLVNIQTEYQWLSKCFSTNVYMVYTVHVNLTDQEVFMFEL